MELIPPGAEQGAVITKGHRAPTVSLPLLVAITALPAVTINIYLPSVPGLVAYFRTDIPTIQYGLSLYLLGLAIGQLAYGPISDRLGRRPVLLAGMVAYCVGSVLCTMAQDIEVFLLGRVLQAGGGAAGMVLGRAMVRDVHDKARVASVLGYTVMITTTATAVAPIIGGTLYELFGWHAPFLFLSAFGGSVLIACIYYAKETANLSIPRSAQFWRGYVQVMKHRSFWRFLTFSALVMASYFSFIAGSPIVVIDLWGYSPTSFGAWWVVGSFSYFMGNYFAGRFSERLGTETMMKIGTPVLLFGGGLLMILLAFGPPHPLSLFVPVGIMFIGSGIMQPSIMSSAINVDPNNIGSASGLLGCTQILCGVLAISVLGFFPTDQPLFFGMICSGTVLLGAILNHALRR